MSREMAHPQAPLLRRSANPLEGAHPTARQSRIRGCSRTGFASLAAPVARLAFSLSLWERAGVRARAACCEKGTNP